jgi:hypothetical protein
MTCLNRRNFLKCSALASLALLPCNPFARQSARAASLLTGDNYYLIHQKELLADFTGALQGAKQFLSPELGADRAQSITQQALKRFESQLPQLPDVGGDRNTDTPFISIAAWYVALYAPMRSVGKTPEDVGKLIYDLNAYSIQSYPPTEKERLFSPEGLAETREWATWTQKRELAANWVAHFVPGDGEDFDYGIDYTECGLVKYFKSQKASELAPYVCLNDFLKSKALGSGLRRTATIASGDGICNFRYKKDRPVTQDWSTEIAEIRRRQS